MCPHRIQSAIATGIRKGLWTSIGFSPRRAQELVAVSNHAEKTMKTATTQPLSLRSVYAVTLIVLVVLAVSVWFLVTPMY